jgi:hypothetical protein
VANDITELRTHLFDTLRGLKDGSVDVDKAKAVSQIADTIIDTAKVEVDFMRVAGGAGTGFIALDGEAPKISKTPTGMKVVEGNVTRHVLK